VLHKCAKCVQLSGWRVAGCLPGSGGQQELTPLAGWACCQELAGHCLYLGRQAWYYVHAHRVPGKQQEKNNSREGELVRPLMNTCDA